MSHTTPKKKIKTNKPKFPYITFNDLDENAISLAIAEASQGNINAKLDLILHGMGVLSEGLKIIKKKIK